MAVALFVTPFWIRKTKFFGLVSKDMHKKNKKTSDLGGLCVIAGFLAGVLFFIGYDVFINQSSASIGYLFAALCSVLIAALLGFSDDILGWKIGLKQWHKVILSVSAAIPIMVINAGESVIHIPFEINLGILFPLVIVPLAIVGASNGFNMIGGFNGLEAGMGILILSTLGYMSYVRDYTVAAVLAFTMVSALIGFLVFNWYPATIFPGNIMTYGVGTLIAIVAILGNIEKYGLLLFIPYLLQFALKARGRMQKESFGKLQAGYLRNRYKKWYGLEHVAISLWHSATEQKVVLSLLAFEGFFILIALSIFYA